MRRVPLLTISLVMCLMANGALAQLNEDLSLCLRGQRAERQGQSEQAISLYTQCLETGGLSRENRQKTHRNIGINYSALKQYDKAIERYDISLALMPADPWADWVNRGNALSALGKFPEALLEYERAVKAAPQFAQALYNRGVVLEKLQRAQEAKADFSAAFQQGLRSSELLERMNFHGLNAQQEVGLSEDQPVPSMDIFRGAIMQIAEFYQGRSVCIPSTENLSTVRPELERQLSSQGVVGLPSPKQIRVVMLTRYPCPFSPQRVQLRPATQADIEGAWVYPLASQKFMFAPQSGNWQQIKSLPPVRCETVAYYPGGEARNTLFYLQADKACPFQRTEDLAATRLNPRVMSWQIMGQGRITITRSDVPQHVEEWDAYVVTQEFELAQMKFKVGDMVSYLRRERGNDLNAATAFRHLQRLP